MPEIIPIKIISPPIVGVPTLLYNMVNWTILSNGPRNLIFEKYLINGLPIKKIIVRDVITESPILKVMYLNTFKKVKVSTNDVKKLKSIRISF